jgi:hypothetical protein
MAAVAAADAALAAAVAVLAPFLSACAEVRDARMHFSL